MTEIIRTPKVSKRRRMLPFAIAERDAAAATKAAAADIEAKQIGYPAANIDDNRSADPEFASDHQRALAAATTRADAAEHRLAELEGEVERHIAEGRERGFEQGYRDGGGRVREEVEKTIQARLESLDILCGAIRDEFDSYLNSAVQDSVVEVVLAAAAKFMGDAIADQNAVVAIVEQMTRHVEDSHGIRVRVSPTDFEFLKNHEWEPAQRNVGPRLEFAPDERIQFGGCIVETSHGDLDARLETQLRRLKEVLLDTRSKQQAGDRE